MKNESKYDEWWELTESRENKCIIHICSCKDEPRCGLKSLESGGVIILFSETGC